MENTVKARLMTYIESKNIKISAFEKLCGLGNGYFRQLRKEPSREKLEIIISKCPDINKDWLLSGTGDMLNGDPPSGKGETADPSAGYLLLPLIHLDSVGGLHSDNAITDMPEFVERRIPFPGAREGDVVIYHTGDSMTPTIPPGSLLHIRRMANWREYLGYGNIFVLVLTDGRRITKEVTRYDEDPADYVWCVSHNPGVPDEELPRSMIESVWKVVNILTNKGW